MSMRQEESMERNGIKQMLEVGTEAALARDTGTPSEWLLMEGGRSSVSGRSVYFFMPRPSGGPFGCVL